MTATDRLREACVERPDHALPFVAFRDPDVHALEMERLFRGDWVAVCAAATLAEPSHYVALSIGGEPVVVLRGSDGTLRALSNVCRHRGTPILDDGFGTGASLVCPYHAWAYDEDGRFRGAPHTGSVDIEPSAHALPRFALEEWGGIIFVNIDGKAPPLSERLRDAGGPLEKFGLERFDTVYGGYAPETWEANWKLAFENGIEAYHLFKIHAETFEKASPTRDSFPHVSGIEASVIAGPVKGSGDSAWPGEPASMGDFERGHYVQLNLPPSFVGFVTRESIGWIAIHPEGPERTRVVAQALVPAAFASGSAADRDRMDDYSQQVLDEDRAICERGQRGMQAHHARGGQLVELEQPLVDFHRYLGSRLFGRR